MASIVKVRSGWRARWRSPDGGSRCRTFDRKVDAERFLTSTEHSKNVGAYVDASAGRVTFGEWWERWFATTVDLRPSTRARDETYARVHLLPRFGPLPLAKLDHLALRTWIADLSASGLAPATVVKAAQIMGKVLRSAVTGGLLAASPADGLTLPRVEREEMKFLGPTEVATLADVIDERYRAMVLLAAYGGLRLGELAALRRSAVDLVRGRVDVAETVVEVKGHHHVGPPKTRAGRRSVPLPRSVLTELEHHAGGLAGVALVFPAPEGGYLRAGLWRRRIWQPATVRAGVAPLRPHDLRHTAVALWIAAGASPKEVAARAGHTSVVTVLDRYGHLLPGTEERVTDALEAMARGARPAPDASVVTLQR